MSWYMLKERYSSLIHFFAFICMFYLIYISACKNKVNTEMEDNTLVKTKLPDDFIEFYKKFHQDSAYQVSHIIFPLPGTEQDTAGRDSSVTWLREDWTLHHTVVPDDLWSVDFTVPLENVIIEFIHAETGDYWMERRFAKMGDEWNLIYYSGLHATPGSVE